MKLVTTFAALELLGPTFSWKTEAHAAGAHQFDAEVDTIFEIGGQDSKVLRLDQRGQVADFAMNDRCAAGTGRFLEVIAARLGHDPAGYLALKMRDRGMGEDPFQPLE